MTVAHYLDTSALVKLAVAEAETAALREWLTAEPRTLAACDLVRTELLRTVRRVAPDRVVMARLVLDTLVLTELTAEVLEAAGRLDASGLRSLHSIHLAAALDLGDDLDTLVTYDEHLANAARSYGVPVTAPA